MLGILADNDITGHWRILLGILEGEHWREFWSELNLQQHSFESLDLDRKVTDAALWHKCQDNQIVLVTGNRNAKGEQSLESVIRKFNRADYLPVITLANAERILADSAYAERTAVRLLEYLHDMDNCRGTGRLWIP